MKTYWMLVALVAAVAGCPEEEIVDKDGDGSSARVDCDDADPDVYPGAVEICDGIDNDCDGAIDDADPDVDAALGATYFLDRDGDGFGDPNHPVQACVLTGQLVVEGSDCDDLDPLTFPGAEEVCDGTDNDCDPATEESGVTFVDAQGQASDLTEAFDLGNRRIPPVVSMDKPGTLYLCEGTYHAGIRISADVDVVGVQGSLATSLDGRGDQHGVYIDAPVSASVSGLTLTDFVDTVQAGGFTAGSALHCSAGAVVEGHDLVVADSFAVLGGAASVLDGCQLTLTNSTFTGSVAVAGGHLAVSDAAAILTNVRFFSGLASVGGAVSVGDVLSVGPFASTELTCTGCWFGGNEAEQGGALYAIHNTATVAVQGRFTDNTATDPLGGGGAYVVGGSQLGEEATLRIVDVYFRRNADAEVASDVVTNGDDVRFYRYGGSTKTVFCDGFDGCG